MKAKQEKKEKTLRPGDKILFKGIDGKEKPGVIESVVSDQLYVVKTPDNKKTLVDKTAIKDLESRHQEAFKKEFQEQIKAKEVDKENKEKPKAKDRHVSFSIITRDYVNGRSNGFEATEKIINATTKDGQNYEVMCSIYGSGVTQSFIRQAVNYAVLNYDGTTSRQDAAFSNDRVQELLNDPSTDYVVYTNGTYVTGEELLENSTLEIDDYIEKTGEYPDESDPFDAIEDYVNAANISKKEAPQSGIDALIGEAEDAYENGEIEPYDYGIDTEDRFDGARTLFDNDD